MTASASVASSALAALLPQASVEVSSRGHQLQALKDNFAAGIDVTITFLPGDNYRHNVGTATALRAAGFNPVPHIAAREMASREELDDFLARLRGEADVKRVLLIAGDVVRVKGPFRSSSDIRASGLLEARGIERLSVAGHPEGHPYLEMADTIKGLTAWRDWGRQTGIHIDVLTQFCFESAPILQWIGQLDADGVDLPVIVGLAGPATPATLTKFALRCGVGNSLRSLRSQIGRFGRLLTDNGPDDVMRGLLSAPPAATATIAGFHLFPFGGLRKAGVWLRDYSAEKLAPLPPRALARGGEGSGVGGSAAFTEAAVPADRPPTPDPSPPLRGGRGEER
jgi:methylenetetrahydrofolate reductase (NADH)